MKDLHLMDIDQVNILFLDKIQEKLVVLVVLSITSTFTLNHCFMKYCVYKFKTKIIKSQQFTCIHIIWGSTLLSISFHLNFFLLCESKALATCYRNMPGLTCIFKCKVQFNTFEIRVFIEINLLKLFPCFTFKGTFDITKL